LNPWQMAQQLARELKLARWPHGSAGLVFGENVFAFAGAPAEDTMPAGFPFALVTIGSGTPDEDDPDLIRQDFSVVVVAEAAGDALGQHAIIGGARADLGNSAGAGVAEVSARARAVINRLTGADGASLIVSGSGTAAPSAVGRGRAIAAEEYRVTALCTDDEHHAPPQSFGLLGDTFSWDGSACQQRFDFLRFRVGYVAGAKPAQRPEQCAAIVYTGTNTETAVAPVPGRAYSVFADYDPRRTGSPAASSAGDAVGAFVTT